jgi:uncharacterized protein involved in exopolysaccharide biosynthesis
MDQVHFRNILNTSSQNINTISLFDFYKFIRQKAKVIIVFIVFSLIIASLYAFLSREFFLTSTIFITKTGNTSTSNLSTLASLAGIQLSGSTNIDPSAYLDKVIQDKDFLFAILHKKWYYNFDSLSLDQIWNWKKDTTVNNWKYTNEMLFLNYIRKRNVLSIENDKRTGVLSLIVLAPSARLSYDINCHAINLLSDYIRNSIKSQAKEKRLFIADRLKEIKSYLDICENTLAHFKENNIGSISPLISLEEMRLTREVALNQELYIQFQKQFEMAKIEELNDQTLIQIIKNPEVPIFKDRPKRLRIIITGLLIGISFGVLFVYFLFILERKLM